MTFIVCATGPSVNNLNWDQLIKYKTIGVNQFFRKNIPTDYYYIYDKMCIIREDPNFTTVIDKWPSTTFYIDKRVPMPAHFRKNTNIVKVTSKSIKREEINNMNLWANSIEDTIYMHKSSVIGAINIAYILKATKIYIAGMDGYGGYFYPHSKNKFENRLHDSLVHYPRFGNVSLSLKAIQSFLSAQNVFLYNMNPESYFVKNNVTEFGVPE